MSKKVGLEDFSLESQQVLRTFGITESTDISQEFNNFLEKNNINLPKHIQDVNYHMKCLAIENELIHYTKQPVKPLITPQQMQEQESYTLASLQESYILAS